MAARAGICIASCCAVSPAARWAAGSRRGRARRGDRAAACEYLGARLCVPERALRPRAQSLALGAAGAFLVGAAASLLVFALFTKCAAFTIHTLAGNCFFACALCFCVFYNGWHLLAAADAPVALHASRVLLLGGLLASTVAEFVIGSHAFMSHYAMHGWFVNQWVVVSLLLAQLALVQIDFLREKLLGLTFADAGDASTRAPRPRPPRRDRRRRAAARRRRRAARGAWTARSKTTSRRENPSAAPAAREEPERAVDESARRPESSPVARARPTPHVRMPPASTPTSTSSRHSAVSAAALGIAGALADGGASSASPAGGCTSIMLSRWRASAAAARACSHVSCR